MKSVVHRVRPVLAACALLLAAACDGGGGTADPQPSVTPSASTATGPSPAETETTPPPSDAAVVPSSTPAVSPAWGSEPVTVVREPSVPPVPVLTGIRSATHPRDGYDRIVFDFRGPLPGYDVRYVPEVRADGSGEIVDVPGRRYLLVVFQPAHAHEDDGTATVTARRTELDYPMMRGFALAGDFEAVVSIGIGLDDVVGFRIGELAGRIYIDVAA